MKKNKEQLHLQLNFIQNNTKLKKMLRMIYTKFKKKKSQNITHFKNQIKKNP